MKILAVADVESKALYDYYHPGKLDGFDLILGCGDLSEDYLEFLMTLADCPLVYVHGNHDENHTKAPLGCICADDKVVKVAGLRILGLGGSMKYREGKYLYTEGQMKRRILRRKFSIWRHRGIDVLLTHAPARGVNDLDDLPHRGFVCFSKLLNRCKPMLFVHGHVHRDYHHNIPQRSIHNGTLVINAFDYAVIEI